MELGYARLRYRLSTLLGIGHGQTHWEFFELVRESGLKSKQVNALRRVTEVYEQAAFAAGSLSPKAVRDSFDAMQTVIELEGESQASSGDE